MPDVLKNPDPYPLDALVEDASAARAIQDFAQGAFGHCVSLPDAESLPPEYRDHRNNVPFSGALRVCPALRAIFDSFHTAKASFRLLRRAPRTAYGLHDDRDKGDDIVRFQIPIVTNPDSFICIQRDGVDLSEVARIVDSIRANEEDEIPFDFGRLSREFGDYLDLYAFDPGYLYFFDTNRIHTAINGSDQERIVLGIDLVVNDWLRDWTSTHLTRSVEPAARESLPAGSWNWSSLRHGVISHPRAECRGPDATG